MKKRKQGNKVKEEVKISWAMVSRFFAVEESLAGLCFFKRRNSEKKIKPTKAIETSAFEKGKPINNKQKR